MKRHPLVRSLSLLVIMVQLFNATLPLYAASEGAFSSDMDGDGLLNSFEEAGWYSAAGGPFFTDPLDADSDDDGLTDGEEKAYDTHPLNAEDPGIYVRYRDTYQTIEYFRPASINPIYPDDGYFSPKKEGYAYLLTRQAGDDYIMSPEAGDGGMVVRRGTSLFIGGPSTATLTFIGSGLTSLTPSAYDAYAGGWTVNFPPNGTVGTYTATVSYGSVPFASMPIYTIFELPTDLSDAEVEAYLYDDDIDNTRDETAVVWFSADPAAKPYTYRCDTVGHEPPCYNENYYYRLTSNWAQALPTKQFEKWIFVDEVMWRIHGETDKSDVVDLLSVGADQEVRVDYDNFGGQASDPHDRRPLSYRIDYILRRYPDPEDPQRRLTQMGTACHAQAGTFTSFLRAIGIPAEPFIVDWRNSSNDHSVRVWLGSWYGARSYSGGEHHDDDYKYYPFEHGITDKVPLQYWDWAGGYGPKNNALITVNENWDWDMVYTGNVYYDRGIDGTEEYYWVSRFPLELQTKHPYIDTLNSIIWGGNSTNRDGWPDAYALPQPYYGGNTNEDWPVEPIAQDCPDDFDGECPYNNEIKGKVWYDLNRDGVYTSTESGIGGALVTLTLLSPTTVYTTTTNGYGTYRFHYFYSYSETPSGTPNTTSYYGLPAGDYVVDVDPSAIPAGYVSTTGNSLPLSFSNGAEGVRYDWFGFAPPLTTSAADVTAGPLASLVQGIASLPMLLWPESQSVAAPVALQNTDPPVTPAEASSTSELLQVGDVVAESGRDFDGDGLYDALALDLAVSVNRAGSYAFGGSLALPNGSTNYGEIYAQTESQYLEAGEQLVSLVFDGQTLGDQGGNGPYQLLRVWATDGTLVDPRLGPWDDVLADLMLNYPTAAYASSLFESTAASFAGKYAHRGLDTDADGRYDTLAVDAVLDLDEVGMHGVTGALYDARGNVVAYADWQGTGSVATLEFSFEDAVAPFTLNELELWDASGEPLDTLWDAVYTISDDEGNFDTSSVRVGVTTVDSGMQRNGTNITSTGVITGYPLNLDGDAEYEQLAVDVAVDVTLDGSYRVEGWLQDADGELVVYGSGAATALVSGTQTLSMTFDGGAINAHGVISGPYTLVSVRVLDGTSNYTMLDELLESGAALDYAADAFESPTQATVVLGDDMESGTDNWTWGGLWTLVEKTWPQATHLWKAGTTSGTGQLNSITLDLSDYVQPILYFKTTHSISAADLESVQVLSQSTWVTEATYTNEFDRQSVAEVDLDSYSEMSNVKLRFNAASQGGSLWYLDDVSLYAWPAVTSASFTYTPTVLQSDQTITFTASYQSIDTSLPITYTWDFGDETGTFVTHDPVITHLFSDSEDHTVKLIVSNPYDSAERVVILSIYQALMDASFTATPEVAEVGTDFTFTAVYTPTDATEPITYSWDFGDTTTTGPTSQQVVTHGYTEGGDYNVRLTATNGYGSAVYDKGISVKEGLTSVSFTYEPDVPIEDDPVSFNADFTSSTASHPITYTWTFDDGTPNVITTTPNISHTFADVDVYHVSVTAYNGYGSLRSYAGDVAIDGRPVAETSFVAMENQPSDGVTAIFTATYVPLNATLPMTYTWNFDDGTVLESVVPVVTHSFSFVEPTLFTVLLTTTNGYETQPVTYSLGVAVPYDDDGDGLTNADEINIYGTDPQNPDTDGDGRTDGEEVNGYLYDAYPPHEHYNEWVTTDPLDPDSDGDGAEDGAEFAIGSYPHDIDTDDDGLLDGEEPGLNLTPHPLIPDTDGDGLLDGEEVYVYYSNPVVPDTDSDGLSDGQEVYTTTTDLLDFDTDDDMRGDGDEWYGYEYTHTVSTVVYEGHPDFGLVITTSATISDTDGEGLLDGQEFDFGTHPKDADTDDDDINDFIEVADNDGVVGVAPLDTDLDGDIDAFDDDSDDDGKLDAVEGTGDIDDDGLPNWRDPDENYPPHAVDDFVHIGENETVTIPVLANDTDLDQDTLTLVGAEPPTNGSIVVGLTVITYTPALDFSGLDTFTYTISDGQASDVGLVTISVNIPNLPPTFTSEPVLTATEDLLYTYVITTSDLDGPAEELVLAAPVLPGWLALVDNGDGTGTLSGTPLDEHVGEHIVTLSVQDAEPLTATQTFTITVVNTNDPPVSVADIYTVEIGSTFYVPADEGVLSNDTDVEQDPMTATLVSNVLHGTLTLQPDGAFVYVHDGSMGTFDSFTYRAFDGEAYGNDANVTIRLIERQGYGIYLPLVIRQN